MFWLKTELENPNQIRERKNLRYIVKLFSSMESTISNPDFNIEEEELKRMKRRKTETRDSESDPKPEMIRWRSESKQRNYSTKLVEAFRQVCCNSSSSLPSAKLSSSSSFVGRHCEIRDTVNRGLVVSAKGKTRWSRAILTSRLNSKLTHNNTKHKKGVNIAGAKVRWALSHIWSRSLDSFSSI